MIRCSAIAIAATVVAAMLGLAAWYGASAETWAGMMLLTTCGALMLSVIGAVCSGSDLRPRLVGFAVFGWGYFGLARWYSYHEGPMPTVFWLRGSGDIHNDLLSLPPDVRIAHDAWALTVAVLGSILAGILFKHGSARAQEPADYRSVSVGSAGWWRGLAFLGMLVFGLVVAAALAGYQWGPEFGADAAFLLTWAVLGVAILGAVCARGRRREAWIGAAAFGFGYMMLAFGSALTTTLPTDHFINAIFRPGGPTTARERPDDDLTTDLESRRVRHALRGPIDLHVPEDTALKLVLEHIKHAIHGSLGKDLVFHAEDSVYRSREFDKGVVTIDRVSISADDALRLCLVQLGLTYRVQSGYVRIVPDAYEPLPFGEDPVMIAGHSLLALVAAVFGGVGAPLVAGLLGRQRASAGISGR